MRLSPINREILALSMPAIASNITTPLLSLADVAIVGHIGSAVYIAAIALGGTVMNMCYWVFSFLRMGSSGVTAQAYGANDAQGEGAVFYRGLAIACALASLLLVFQGPLTAFVLDFMEADRTATELAERYVSICIWGAPAVLCSTVLSGWMLGMQYSRGPMWMALVTNVTNIAASGFFVFVMHMDIAGVATGTCIAQWAGMLTGLYLIRKRFAIAPPQWLRISDRRELLDFFAINFDIFLRTLCLVAVTLWFTHAGAKQGNDILAANALLMQFFMLFSYFTDGFAFAGEALSGKFYGERNFKALDRCIRSLIRTGAAMALIFVCIYFFAGNGIMNILTSDRNVTETAREYFGWALAVPVAGFMAFTWDGIFGGLTQTRIGLLVPMAVATLLFFGVYAVSVPLWGNHGLWAAFVVYCATRGIAQTLYYRIYKRRHYQ